MHYRISNPAGQIGCQERKATMFFRQSREETYIRTYIVEADSLEAAQKLFNEGEGDEIDEDEVDISIISDVEQCDEYGNVIKQPAEPVIIDGLEFVPMQ